MKSEFPLDYAVFQLSPRRSRCELFVSYDGTTEKIASGLLKPFLTHLKAAKEQVASSVKSITLEVENCRSSETWFTKGTLERFVRFVNTPEVLELVYTCDAEVSQLEAARKIYSQGPGEGSVGDGGATTTSDATKKELLRAIDVRLITVRQDLSTACARASAAGFNPDTVLELQHFANQFGAHRLSESFCNFMSLCQRRPEFFPARKSRVDDQAVQSSSVSDTSLDDQDNEFKSATMQRMNKPSATVPSYSTSSRESSFDRDDNKESSDMDKQKKGDTSLVKGDSETPSTGPRPPARQLSVQERISLFENKKQENSSSGSGSKPVIEKSAELRRLSSDVSSTGQTGFEKAVLRRWSGAGDMSIGERKEADSCAQTPTLTPIKTSTSSIVSDDMGQMSIHLSGERKEIDASQFGNIRLENESDPRKGLESNHVTTKLGAQLTVFSGASEEVCSQSKSASFSGGSESDGWKDESNFGTRSKGSFDGPQDFGFENQIISLAMPGKMDQFASRALSSSEEEATTSFVAQKAQLVVPPSRFGYDILDCDTYEDTADPDDMGSRNKNVPKSHLRTFHKAAIDCGSTSESSVVSSVPVVSHNKETDPDQMIATPKWRSLGGIVEAGKDYKSAEKQSSVESKGSGSHKMKFQRHSSASTHVKKSRGKKDDSGSGLRMPGGAGKTISDNQEMFSSISTTSMEQGQRMKQSKGNQELNDELKQKANELEKLFAEHKSNVTRGSKSIKTEKHSPVEVSTPQAASIKMIPEPSHSSCKKKSTSSPLTQPLENQDFDGTPKQNMHGLGFSDKARGTLYDKYTQKRDAKLKEEWSLKRDEKEARMKLLQDSLERSRSEMKSKLAGLNNSQDSRHRAEKLRSFSSRSGIRQKQPIHSFVSDEDKDRAEFGQGNLTSEMYMADGSFRSPHSKKALLNNNAVSSTRPIAGAPASRSVKASASSASRQKLQTENPLAQSVPNFSEFRKEKNKPSTTPSKGKGLPQVRNSGKSPTNPLESKDFPSLNFEAKTFVNVGEEFINTAKEEEDLESPIYEDYDNMDKGRPRSSQESIKSANSRFEIGDVLGVPSESNPSSMAEMPSALPSPFRSRASVLDSPGESPGSWHSRVHNPYSFQHEMSDFDASVDSPVGSPAYWNTNDSDAARMRKKWGATQKRVVLDSSHSQSRKDVTKGLKRFLKFGRKNRGTDSLADWVSATTSEGDDDTEDGKDPAGNKSSDDLRKSRMGFLHYHNDDGFSETDSFSEQVNGFPSSSPTPMNFKLREDHLSGSALKAPKSFFSLSTFRSKGSDSKPR